MISLDARSGYHQIRVRESDEEKLVFFNPSGTKKKLRVMPFGPKHFPTFYIAMMQSLRTDWLLLFADTKHVISRDNVPDTFICNDKTIIDDILLHSNHVPSLLHYFSCVAQVFTKYRLSFKLTKCDFFKTHVEFVGHDLTTYGNCPAESKFDLTQHWPLPPNTISLLSFISPCGFYS